MLCTPGASVRGRTSRERIHPQYLAGDPFVSETVDHAIVRMPAERAEYPEEVVPGEALDLSSRGRYDPTDRAVRIGEVVGAVGQGQPRGIGSPTRISDQPFRLAGGMIDLPGGQFDD